MKKSSERMTKIQELKDVILKYGCVYVDCMEWLMPPLRTQEFFLRTGIKIKIKNEPYGKGFTIIKI